MTWRSSLWRPSSPRASRSLPRSCCHLWIRPCSSLLSLLLLPWLAFRCRFSVRRGGSRETPCDSLSRLVALSLLSLVPACLCCWLGSSCSTRNLSLASLPCCSTMQLFRLSLLREETSGRASSILDGSWPESLEVKKLPSVGNPR